MAISGANAICSYHRMNQVVFVHSMGLICFHGVLRYRGESVIVAILPRGHASFLGFDNLTGSRFADTLAGSAGANALQGGEGNDLIWGSAGTDRRNGSPGADQFLHRSEAKIGNAMDACDRILNANPAKSGDQAFSWIASSGVEFQILLSSS